MRVFLLVIPWLIIIVQYKQDPENWTWWVLLVPLVFLLVVLFIVPLIDRVFHERRIQSVPSAFSPQTYAFSDAGIEIVGENKQVKLNWSAIVKASESSSDFFLFVGSNIAHFVPKRFLAESGQETKLRDILRRNLKGKTAF